MKDRSPSGHIEHHETTLHQKGMHNKSPSAVEPHPQGGSVDHDKMSSAGGTRTEVPGVPTIGPRTA
jgi:hypothetical protein